ncbi:MAG: NAD(P)-dependent glycerol-3-phosphate dehydrogenase [Planctomycetes bacterium]|nr:NAD(P)-dependent glycerol-3-phosphate dehydrogenase [Planctomycetota bacterium]
MKICTLGAGSWGTAFSHLLSSTKKVETAIWSRRKEISDSIRTKKMNPFYLSGFELSNFIKPADVMDLSAYETYLVAIPVQHIRSTLEIIHPHLNRQALFVSLSKGIEIDTFKRPTEIISEVTGSIKVMVLSGPSHAEEVVQLLPTSVVLAADDEKMSMNLQHEISSEVFRVYTSDDVIGVELAAAVKNVLAIASGITKGLGLGDNAVSSLVTRGVAEITRFIVHFGGHKETIFGLAGIGDILTTCFSSHSRNFFVGTQIAAGKTIESITKQMRQVAEGIHTVKAINKICGGTTKKLDMPICHEIYKILYDGKDPRKSLKDLMSRPLKQEKI